MACVDTLASPTRLLETLTAMDLRVLITLNYGKAIQKDQTILSLSK